jgi:hypothetical protein
LRKDKYLPKFLSEVERRPCRYGASSKYRRLADIIVMNHKLNNEWIITIM